jgi:protein SCO1/2
MGSSITGRDCAPSSGERLRPRRIGAAVLAVLAVVLLGGLDASVWQASLDVSGNALPLELRMTRAPDGREVTEADYRVVLLYFGYTHCPDLCPLTLVNLAAVLKRLGPDAKRVRVLFVAVDPQRDTLAVLAKYVKAFAPQVEGLRGSPDELAALAGRYHADYSVTPATGDHPYEVTHSAVIYVFDGSGAARLLIPSLGDAKPDLDGTAADLRRIVEETRRGSGSVLPAHAPQLEAGASG